MLEGDEFQLARSYFDMKEFDRVVHTLREAGGNRARFLRTYSAYLVSFHRPVTSSSFADGTLSPPIGKHKNPSLISLIRKKNV